ncbi:DUF6527 family protein [Pseudomonas sp. IT-P395]|uniref:DUF6527 family protein n=1 Tax=Pseudomonas sp. IT-P395 TaxID=3026459 RepID=UPI0039E0976D
MLKKLFQYVVSKLDPLLPARTLTVIEGDSLPAKMPMRSLVLARDGQEDWCVGFKCPCGCGHTIELLLIEEARPRWDCELDKHGHPSLHPSVWLKSGCKSHFWIRHGKVHWA